MMEGYSRTVSFCVVFGLVWFVVYNCDDAVAYWEEELVRFV